MNVLERIVEVTREDVRRRRREVPLAELERHIGHHEERPFAEALARPGVSIIAEHKRRSPSAGDIRAGSTVGDIVAAYERGGASALSILTEGPHFGGALDDLREARSVSVLPILRKDFVVDAYQVYETAAWGADAMLLIVAALTDGELAALHREARDLDLDVLVEVHSEEELERALEVVDADVIGINNRDLADFSVDVERTYALLADVPAGKTVVSESGFHEREQLEELERVGVDAVLVGESLMRTEDPEAAVRTSSGPPTRFRNFLRAVEVRLRPRAHTARHEPQTPRAGGRGGCGDRRRRGRRGRRGHRRRRQDHHRHPAVAPGRLGHRPPRLVVGRRAHRAPDLRARRARRRVHPRRRRAAVPVAVRPLPDRAARAVHRLGLRDRQGRPTSSPTRTSSTAPCG